MAATPKAPGRLTHTETTALSPRRLDSFAKGDVFLRAGTPCMMVHGNLPAPDDHRLWVVNLTNGSAWPAAWDDMVDPVTDVHLTFASSRRDR